MKPTLFAAGLLAGCSLGWAQSPAGGQFQVNTTTRGFQDYPQAAMADDGRFVVVWQQSTGDEAVRGIFAQRFASGGGRDGGEFRVDDGRESYRFSPALAAGAGGDFAVVWSSFDGVRTEAFGRRFDGVGRPEGPQVALDPEVAGDKATDAVAFTPSGDLLAVWSNRAPGTPEPDSEVFLQRLAPSGERLGPGVQANTFTAGNQTRGAVAVGGADSAGDFIVVWNSAEQDGSDLGIFGQRFAASGERLGPEFQVNTFTAARQALPSIAADAAGNFVVVWQSYRQDGSDYGVFAQRFDAAGQRVGGEFRINGSTASGQSHPSVAADAAGNFVVAWDDYLDVWARLYRSDGTPVGGEQRLTTDPIHDQRLPSVSFGGNGTFVVAWVDTGRDGSDRGVFAQLFTASPGTEPCVFRSGRFLCDTARTGGAAEVSLPFGRAGDLPLLGDVDGDGRADPCLRRARRFLCDTAHDGGTAEVRILFGASTDHPLLGDVDGDGRADPCLVRAGVFLCDTAHNGGGAEVAIVFGQPGDRPLLGDVDGDGCADPCVRRGRDFLCDTAHDGGAAEVRLRFGLAADPPLLGDADGDGDADPCVHRAGRLLCDTAHDGSPADFVLAFGQAGDVLLLGNLDGL